jgi:Ca2+-binding RTX toxin-like protein
MAVVNGTKLNDFKLGTTDADNIFGLDGNDTLLGLAGDDTLDGGKGADLMDGGDGDDTYIPAIGTTAKRYIGGSNGTVHRYENERAN